MVSFLNSLSPLPLWAPLERGQSEKSAWSYEPDRNGEGKAVGTTGTESTLRTGLERLSHRDIIPVQQGSSSPLEQNQGFLVIDDSDELIGGGFRQITLCLNDEKAG